MLTTTTQKLFLFFGIMCILFYSCPRDNYSPLGSDSNLFFFQEQDVTNAAVTSIIPETTVQPATMMPSSAPTQTTFENHPTTASAQHLTTLSQLATESSRTIQSSGTMLPQYPAVGSTGTKTARTSATTLKAGSMALCGFCGHLLLPVMVLLYSAQS